LEYGITVNNVSVHTGIEKGTGTLTFMASTGELAYYTRSGGCAHSGIQGQSLWWEVGGEGLKLNAF